MIRGSVAAFSSVPLVRTDVMFPTLDGVALSIRFVVDTGAHNVVIGSLDSLRMERDLGVAFADLPLDSEGITGVGGTAMSRRVRGHVALGNQVFELDLKVMPPYSGTGPPVPSLMGRQILDSVAVFIDRRNDLVLLYE